MTRPVLSCRNLAGIEPRVRLGRRRGRDRSGAVQYRRRACRVKPRRATSSQGRGGRTLPDQRGRLRQPGPATAGAQDRARADQCGVRHRRRRVPCGRVGRRTRSGRRSSVVSPPRGWPWRAPWASPRWCSSPARAATPAIVAVALFAGGACDALVDVAQNTHGLRVQRVYGRSIINSLHAVWSAGAVLGGADGRCGDRAARVPYHPPCLFGSGVQRGGARRSAVPAARTRPRARPVARPRATADRAGPST